MTKIQNLERIVEQDPMRGLLMGLPGAIEASERRGQQELVASESLPTDTRGDDAAFLALGFTFGEPDADDPIFRPATLPTGWKREASDHSMWSHIVDERGIRRASIFYKAAFYDRSAAMHLANVAGNLASDAMYADTLPTSASLRLDRLTPDEIAEFRAYLDRKREDVARSPDIYGKYAPNLAACDTALAAHVL